MVLVPPSLRSQHSESERLLSGADRTPDRRSLHGDFFRYYPTGSSDHFEYTDTVMLCQGQRGIIEIDFANTGRFMFHAHQSEFTELGWMGFFEVFD
jgi:hypothetical protein